MCTIDNIDDFTFLLLKMLPMQNLDTSHKGSETRVKLNCYLLHSTHGKYTYVINMPSTITRKFETFKKKILIHYFYLYIISYCAQISKYLFLLCT